MSIRSPGWMARAALAATGSLLMMAAAGCGEPGDPEGSVTLTTSPLLPMYMTDASGNIQIQINACSAGPSQSGRRCSFCGVEAGWIRIGGGAQILGSPSNARLQASRPSTAGQANNEGCTGEYDPASSGDVWLARSLGTSVHSLQAYSIGLKVTGLTEQQLRSYITDVNENTTAPGSQVSISVPASSNPVFQLIGGGAEILPETAAGYLTELYPVGPNLFSMEWKGSAVFPGGAMGSLKVYSIGIDPCLPLPGSDDVGTGGCLDLKWRTVTTGPVSGYGSASTVTPYPWAMTTVGGQGVSNGASSRYLADLIPYSTTSGNVPGIFVTTKDQGSAVNKVTTGYSLNLTQGGVFPWKYNAIQFFTSSAAFSRPAGAAPVDLKQTTASPNAAPQRWFLEDFGGGQFRVRNSNPGLQSGECAAREAGNLNVRVKPCGTSTDFLWTIQGGTMNANFHLRNVANGRCIDNLGQGFTTATLAFRACAAGFSSAQSLSLNAFSWPP